MFRVKILAVLLVTSFWSLTLVVDKAVAADFYDGKKVRVIHGFGTGGGFDTAARVVTKHLTKHVPGNPVFVVESMKGASGLVAMNFVYNKAKNDGLTMGFLFASLFVDEAMGSPGVKFDSSKFEWLGAPSGGTPICALTSKSGIKSLEDWKNASSPVKIGAIGKGAEYAFSMPKMLQTQGGFPTQIIVGHKGGNPTLKLASERGEIAGFCGSLESTSILWGEQIKKGEVNVIVQFVDKPNPLIPNVALAKDHITTSDGADLIRVAITGPIQLNRIFSFPPGTAAEHVAIMRKGLMATFKDPEFIADAKKVKVNVNPVDGSGVEKIVAGFHSVSKPTLAKLKTILEVN